MRHPVVLLALLAAAPVARAQPAAERFVPPYRASAATLPAPVWQQPWTRPAASLLVPGTGQLLAGRDRGVMYLVAEAWFLARALASSAQGRQLRGQFQTLAFDVARSQFTATKLNGPWDYYETMSHYVESGPYNTATVPGGFQPPTDTLTFNGAMWLLARRNYLENPDSIPAPSDLHYQAAVAFYKSRAFGDAYRWSWKDARLEMDVYAREIHDSDNAYRAATNYLGAMLVNHLISAIDAFIMVRLGAREAGVLPRPSLLPGASGAALVWTATF